jgi:hypothetical protein
MAAAADAVEPTVFVFHVSRCGSTLFSQLFALDPRAIVVSEAPPLDDALAGDPQTRDARFADTLRLLGRRRFGDETHLVVKTDSWHLLEAGRLRAMYPRVPFILLYRDPRAVLASHRRVRGRQMVPGLIDPRRLGLSDADRASPLDDYGARVLERYYRALLEFSERDPLARLVAYEEGFPAAFLEAARWLGRSVAAADEARIADRCRFHGKRPEEAFDGDTLAASSDRPELDRLYAGLEAARRRPR